MFSYWCSSESCTIKFVFEVLWISIGHPSPPQLDSLIYLWDIIFRSRWSPAALGLSFHSSHFHLFIAVIVYLLWWTAHAWYYRYVMTWQGRFSFCQNMTELHLVMYSFVLVILVREHKQRDSSNWLLISESNHDNYAKSCIGQTSALRFRNQITFLDRTGLEFSILIIVQVTS